MLNLSFIVEDENSFIVINKDFDENLRGLDNLVSVYTSSIRSCNCPQISPDEGVIYLNGEDKQLDRELSSGHSYRANLELFKKRLELGVNIFNDFEAHA